MCLCKLAVLYARSTYFGTSQCLVTSLMLDCIGQIFFEKQHWSGSTSSDCLCEMTLFLLIVGALAKTSTWCQMNHTYLSILPTPLVGDCFFVQNPSNSVILTDWLCEITLFLLSCLCVGKNFHLMWDESYLAFNSTHTPVCDCFFVQNASYVQNILTDCLCEMTLFLLSCWCVGKDFHMMWDESYLALILGNLAYRLSVINSL